MRAKTAADRYGKGEIGYNEYIKEWKKAVNTSLLNLHNTYLKGQKEFGYTYTLEKR